MHSILIRNILRPIDLVAGINLEELPPIQTALRAIPALDVGEVPDQPDTELGRPFPAAERTVRGVQIVVSGLEAAGDELGTGGRCEAPPALARPIVAVKPAQRHNDWLRTFVADGKSGVRRHGGGQKNHDRQHEAHGADFARTQDLVKSWPALGPTGFQIDGSVQGRSAVADSVSGASIG